MINVFIHAVFFYKKQSKKQTNCVSYVYLKNILWFCFLAKKKKDSFYFLNTKKRNMGPEKFDSKNFSTVLELC